MERGPTPRALAQARIQVKSEPHAPRVRSSKLQPRRHVRTGPNPLLEDTPLTPLPDVTSSRVVPKTATLLPDLEASKSGSKVAVFGTTLDDVTSGNGVSGVSSNSGFGPVRTCRLGCNLLERTRGACGSDFTCMRA